MGTISPRVLRGRGEWRVRGLQLPTEVIEIEQQYRFRIRSSKLFERARRPSLGQVLAGIKIFLKKSVLVGNAEKSEHGRNHVEMRNQHRLCEILGELFVVLLDTRPETRGSFAQMLGVEFHHMRARFERIVKLIGFQFSKGNAANQLCEPRFSELLIHVAKLHARSVAHRLILPAKTLPTRYNDRVWP